MKRFFDKLKSFFIGEESRSKNFVRYLIIVIAFLSCLFFSNDFDLIDIQKTAIVTAIGIDREGEDFSITSQIALPGESEGEGSSKSVNVVAKGKTVAQALDQINEKTGWYPKLVFCRLILLGESATSQNVFDGLDYFLRDEYITDNCLLAACEGKAESILQAKTPLESASALAIEKVLSSHAERLGTSLPNTLREFSSSYYASSQSGFLPLIKTESLAPPTKGQAAPSSTPSKNSGNKKETEEEKSFSAEQTALFIQGKQIGTLDKRHTFALALVKNPLRLAAYTLPFDGKTYTATIKRASPNVSLSKGASTLKVEIDVTMGLADVSKAQSLQDTADAGDFPRELLSALQQQLQEDVRSLFLHCQSLGFDAFDAIDKLQKYEHAHFEEKKETLLQDVALSVDVKVRTIR